MASWPMTDKTTEDERDDGQRRMDAAAEALLASPSVQRQINAQQTQACRTRYRQEAAQYAWKRWPDDPEMRSWFRKIACADSAPLTADDLAWAANQVRQIEAERKRNEQ